MKGEVQLEHKNSNYVVVCYYQSGLSESHTYFDEEGMGEVIGDHIRKFGKDNVVLYPPLSNDTYEEAGIDADAEDADRYPDLYVEVDGPVVYVCKPSEHCKEGEVLMQIDVDEIPRYLVRDWSKLLEWIKDTYDTSLVDLYYSQD